MKKIQIILLMLAVVLIAHSQKLVVESFRLLPNDLTANIEGTQRFDPNTRKNAALIKVVTSETGFYFDGGMSGLVGDPKQEIGEVWVYVPEGSKKITIKHTNLGVLRDYFYPEGALRSGKTYEMVLITGKTHTIIEEDLGSNFAVLKITPKNAEVYIDGNIVEVDAEGVVQSWLSYGKHTYEVSANMHKKEIGVLTITSDAKTEKDITLEADYSTLKINSTPSGATLYIDNEEVGTTPLTTKPIESGEHTFQFKKTMYLPKTVTHIVNSGGGVQTISETLQANFSEITITAPNQSEIYVNNEKKGEGSWTGTLNAGDYIVEARKESHHSTKTSLKVVVGTPQTITLEAPIPRYGVIMAQSTPALATFIVDGKEIGETPGAYKNILIGERQVTIKKDGYATWTGKVIVEEGKTSPLSVTLQKLSAVKFTTPKNSSTVYVDGKYIGNANTTYYLSPGTHKIEFYSLGSKYYTTTLNVGNGEEVQEVKYVESAPAPTISRTTIPSTTTPSVKQSGYSAAQQGMSVESFCLSPNDLTANLEGFKRYDPNTRKNAALIKVVTTEKDFYFDGGMMGLVGDPNYKIGEVWVYVPEGAKKITIKHPKLGTLRDYFYPETIKSGKTYKMVLSTGKIVTYVESVPSKGTHNGHEYVDLGLSVKWATCNVGATSPEDYGDYFAWGETTPKTTYNWSTYKYCNGSYNSMTKYCTRLCDGTVDYKTELDLSDDAARANWGGSWRMPTRAEQDELRDTNNCTWTWTTQNGVKGYKVTSKKNGNSIFLPAAGYRYGSDLSNVGSYGDYWSSSLNTSGSGDAFYLNFNSGRVGWRSSDRYDGRSVRAVCE